MSRSILFICLVGLFVASNALELIKLCSERIYENGKTVNAFYRLKLEKTLDPIHRYMVDAEHPNYDLYEELLSSIFGADMIDLSEIMQRFTVVKNESVPSIKPVSHGYFRPGRRAWPRSFPVDHREESLRALKLVFKDLAENRISEQFISTYKLAKELAAVGPLGALQRSIFRDKFLNVFYKKPIAQFDKLIAKRNQSLYLDDTATATLHYSLYIPMYERNEAVTKSCFSTIDLLPKFYTEETEALVKMDENEVDPAFSETASLIDSLVKTGQVRSEDGSILIDYK